MLSAQGEEMPEANPAPCVSGQRVEEGSASRARSRAGRGEPPAAGISEASSSAKLAQ